MTDFSLKCHISIKELNQRRFKESRLIYPSSIAIVNELLMKFEELFSKIVALKKDMSIRDMFKKYSHELKEISQRNLYTMKIDDFPNLDSLDIPIEYPLEAIMNYSIIQGFLSTYFRIDTFQVRQMRGVSKSDFDIYTIPLEHHVIDLSINDKTIVFGVLGK